MFFCRRPYILSDSIGGLGGDSGLGAIGNIGSSIIGGGVDLYMNASNNEANADQNALNNAQQLSEFASAQTFNGVQAELNRQFQSDQADKQRSWEETMSNSAIQRQAKDYAAAGFNPILAVNNGGASTPISSTPSGDSASSPSPSVPSRIPMNAARISDAVKLAINSALDSQRVHNESKSTDAEVKLKAAAAKTQETQSQLNVSSAKKAEAEAQISKTQLPAVQSEAELRKLRADLDSGAVTYDFYVKHVKDILGGLRDAGIAVYGAKKIMSPSSAKSLPDQSNLPLNTHDQYFDNTGKYTGGRIRTYE